MKKRHDHIFIFNQQAYLLFFSTNLEQTCYFKPKYNLLLLSYILLEPGVWKLPQPIDIYLIDSLLKTIIGYIRYVKKFDN